MARLLSCFAAPAVGLALFVSAPSVDAQICEEDGLIVAEIESVPTSGSWASETATGGYAGSSYYRWFGADQFNSPGNGVLTYTLEVTNPGDYNMRIRNYHDDPDATMENDCWTRMDGSTWVKTYSKFANTWTWSTRFEFENGFKEDAHFNLTAGTHSFQISGRSNDFRIDRVHFYLNTVSGNPTDPGLPPSPTGPCNEPVIWEDLGGATTGVAGVPQLAMGGDLSPGSLVSLDLSQGAPAALAIVFISFASTPASFLGGTLYAFPVDELVIAGTDGTGKLSGAALFPGAPTGSELTFQIGIEDATVPLFGASLSNGVLGTVP